jgi:hypothetical protein
MSQEEPKPDAAAASSINWTAPDEGVCEAYTDWFHVNWMPLTVRIRFGQFVADPGNPPDKATWVIDERAALTIPWATAKSLAEMLGKLIAAYEKTNGEITIPTIPSLE